MIGITAAISVRFVPVPAGLDLASPFDVPKPKTIRGGGTPTALCTRLPLLNADREEWLGTVGDDDLPGRGSRLCTASSDDCSPWEGKFGISIEWRHGEGPRLSQCCRGNVRVPPSSFHTSGLLHRSQGSHCFASPTLTAAPGDDRRASTLCTGEAAVPAKMKQAGAWGVALSRGRTRTCGFATASAAQDGHRIAEQGTQAPIWHLSNFAQKL